jgi:hypothetical protein
LLLSEATSSQNAVIIKLSRGFPTNIIHRLQSTICHHSLETLFEQFVCRRLVLRIPRKIQRWVNGPGQLH